MQATKNGLKSTLRTPGKTLLFLLILTVTAALLNIPCSVYGAVRGYLGNCDDYFHTIAELEYVGQYYPSQMIYAESFAAAVEENRDTLSALIHAEQVLSWEPASNERMLSPDIHRWDDFVPEPEAAVMRVKLYGSTPRWSPKRCIRATTTPESSFCSGTSTARRFWTIPLPI